MVEIVATVNSLVQAQSLIDADIDTLYVGEDLFGLRLPHSFERDELAQIVELAHKNHKKVQVAVNAIMHNDRIVLIQDYLEFLAGLKVDRITVGDPGVINILLENKIDLPYVYDAAVLVTSARQINFWAKRGAVGAVLAHEVPYLEMVDLAPQLMVPAEVLVYGAACIHQSGRPLLDNYFNFVQKHQDKMDRAQGLFVSEPKKENTHYSIYEDINGTHVFADKDLDLLPELAKLYELSLTTWKLDGLYCEEEKFIAIANAFVAAKKALEEGTWNVEVAAQLDQIVQDNTAQNRELDTGFFNFDPMEVR